MSLLLWFIVGDVVALVMLVAVMVLQLVFDERNVWNGSPEDELRDLTYHYAGHEEEYR